MDIKGRSTFLVALATVIGVQAAHAQQEPYHLALPGIPSGTVAPSGLGFVGLSVTDKRGPGQSDGDGSAVIGFGFGDAVDGVGGQVTLNITSLSDSFGDSGYLSLKFAKQLSDGPSPVYGSLQFGQLANWGDANGQDVTTDIAFTRFSHLSAGDGRNRLPVMMTIGAGSHVRNADTDPGVFGGFGIGVSPTTALSMAWTGDDLTLGGSLRFKGAEDLIVSFAVDDVTDRNDSRRLIVSFGYRFPNLFGGSR